MTSSSTSVASSAPGSGRVKVNISVRSSLGNRMTGEPVTIDADAILCVVVAVSKEIPSADKADVTL